MKSDHVTYKSNYKPLQSMINLQALIISMKVTSQGYDFSNSS